MSDALHPTPPLDAPAPRRRRLGTPRQVRVLLALAVVCALAWGTPALDGVSRGLSLVFEASVASRVALHEAGQFKTEQGELEYAVHLADADAEPTLRSYLEGRAGLRYLRPSIVPGWHVVAVGDEAELAALRAEPYVGLAMANRGTWICH